MKSWMVRAVAPVALIALLGGCNLIKKAGGGGSPKGQVVATVDGQEVTMAELQAELGGQIPSDPATAKAVEQQALQRIIARDLLAKAAHDQKLDQSPEYAVQLQRAKRDLAASFLEKELASEVPPPTKDEADRYVADHPTMFSGRQLMILDQVQAQKSNDKSLISALEPLKDLGQVEALLSSKNVAHQRGMTVVDTLRLDPRMVEQLQKLPSDELFILNTPSALSINQVKESKPMPLTGDQASQLALRLLANQRSQEAITKQAQAIIASAKDKIKYNPDFQPAKVSAQPLNVSPSAGAQETPPPPSPSATSLPAQQSQPQQGQPFTLGK